jgi:hypothetical protein
MAADVINFVWKFNMTYVYWFCLCIDWQLPLLSAMALKGAHDTLELQMISVRQFSRETIDVPANDV